MGLIRHLFYSRNTPKIIYVPPPSLRSPISFPDAPAHSKFACCICHCLILGNFCSKILQTVERSTPSQCYTPIWPLELLFRVRLRQWVLAPCSSQTYSRHAKASPSLNCDFFVCARGLANSKDTYGINSTIHSSTYGQARKSLLGVVCQQLGAGKMLLQFAKSILARGERFLQ